MKVTLPNGVIAEGTTAELAPLLGIEAGAIAPVAPKPAPKPVEPAAKALPVSLTPKQHAVTEALRMGDISAQDVALHLGITTPAAWGLLGTLKEKGIVANQDGTWQLTKLAKVTTFEPTASARHFGAVHETPEVVVPVPDTGITKVLSVVLYDTLQTMLDYGDPIKAAGIGTLMGLPTTTISGRLDMLKAQGLIEQYPNHTTWRVVPEARHYTYYPEGMA